MHLGLLRGDHHGRHHDLDGQGHDLTLAILVPAIVLDEKLEHVVDVDQFAVEGGRYLRQQRVQILRYLVLSFLVEVFLVRDLERENPIDGLTFFTSFKFDIDNVFDLFTNSFSSCTSFVAANKLEFEVFDVLVALGVISDDAHLGYLSQIVLILVEKDLRN